MTIWFGVIILLITSMAVMTPPVGVNVYIVKGVAKDVPLEAIFKGVWPFVLADLAAIALLIAFPKIATFCRIYYSKAIFIIRHRLKQ